MTKRKNTDTSIEAYRSLDPNNLADIYSRILWALSQITEGTWEDISIALKEKDSRIWRRLNEMQKMDLIYRTEHKKVLSSGRKGFTWKATLKGSPTLQDHSRNIQAIKTTVQRLF